jgi:hypothetical protein
MQIMKKYKRYVSCMDKTKKEVFDSVVMHLETEIMDVPYYTVELRILDFEPNYIGSRPTLSFRSRLKKAIREAVTVFKAVIKTG